MVLVFGGRHRLVAGEALARLHAAYPEALLVGCATAGEIAGERVHDDTVVATAVAFESTRVRAAAEQVELASDSRACGAALGRALAGPDLGHVLVFSDGLVVNGSELVGGLAGALPPAVAATGGLAADGERFEETPVVWGPEARAGRVVAVGLYGADLRVGYGSLGGWDTFGPERLVTRAEGNVLYELDGRSALALYKAYLGEHAAGLPATALHFPLSIRPEGDEPPLVRTVLSVDEESQTMTFAGDIPQGRHVRLMRANFNRLVDGAHGAASAAVRPLQDGDLRASLALLISCVGRRITLRQRVEEELEAVREVCGDEATMTGFYSYGELAPFVGGGRCELHNQTMTITLLAETGSG